MKGFSLNNFSLFQRSYWLKFIHCQMLLFALFTCTLCFRFQHFFCEFYLTLFFLFTFLSVFFCLLYFFPENILSFCITVTVYKLKRSKGRYLQQEIAHSIFRRHYFQEQEKGKAVGLSPTRVTSNSMANKPKPRLCRLVNLLLINFLFTAISL